MVKRKHSALGPGLMLYAKSGRGDVMVTHNGLTSCSSEHGSNKAKGNVAAYTPVWFPWTAFHESNPF